MKDSRNSTQSRILAFLEEYIASHGYPPTMREIAAAVQLSSIATVHGHLKRLESKGLIKRDLSRPRAIQILENKQDQNEACGIVEVPVLGHVAAGLPILAEEHVEETIPLPKAMLTDGKHYILKVHGDSMIDCGIMDGDYAVVRYQQTAVNGDIVVAVIDGCATVKRFFRQNGQIRLQPENRNMAPIYVKNVLISGKVVSSYRVY